MYSQIDRQINRQINRQYIDRQAKRQEDINKLVSQSGAEAKTKIFWRATGQSNWKTGTLTIAHLCEDENQTLEAFTVAIREFQGPP